MNTLFDIKKFLIITGIFFLVYFSPILFFNKTLLTHAPFYDIEGSSGYAGFIPKVLTRIDPGGSAWIDEPLAQVTASKIHQGKLPLWNQYSGAGTPLFANQVSNAFSLIRYIVPVNIFPNAYMWDIFLIFRLFILCLLFYLYLRLIRISFIPSLLASWLITFSGHFLYYINLFQLDVEIITPLLFIGLECYLQKKKNSIFIILTAMFLLIVGGNAQSTIIAVTFGTSYYVMRLLFEKNTWKANIAHFMQLIGVYGVGLLLTAFYLLPFIEFFLNSFHVHSEGTGMQHFPISAFPALFLPYIFGPIHSFWLGVDQHSIPSFLSTIAMLIFVAGCLFWIQKRVQKEPVFSQEMLKYIMPFLIIFCIFLTKAFNIPLINMIGELPIFNRVVFMKYIVPLYFSFFVLVAIIIDTLLLKKTQNPKTMSFPYIIMSFLFLTAMFCIGIVSVIKGEPHLADKYLKLNFISKHTGVIYAIAAMSFCGFFFFFSRKELYKKAFLVLIVVIELLAVNYQIVKNTYDRFDTYNHPAEYVSYIKNDSQTLFRIYGIEKLFISQIPAGHLIEDLRILDALDVNRHMVFMREFITGYDSREYPFYSGGFGFLNDKSISFLQMANVKYLLVYNDGTHAPSTAILKKNIYPEVLKDGRVSVLRLSEKPRAFIPSKVTFMQNDQQVLEYMKKPSFDPLNNVVISSNTDHGSTVCKSNDTNTVQIIQNQGDFYHININNSCENGYLFISNTFYPGWQASINGEKTSLYQANYAFQGIKLPKGDNLQIELRYVPLSFYGGLAISFVTLISCIIGFIIRRQRNSKKL